MKKALKFCYIMTVHNTVVISIDVINMIKDCDVAESAAEKAAEELADCLKPKSTKKDDGTKITAAGDKKSSKKPRKN